MSYTPTTWTTGDTITATKLNKIEQGIANAGGGASWDAVIRLTHSNDSGADAPGNLTPSIVSGSFSDLYSKLSNGGCPIILVEYYHPAYMIQYSTIMGYITYFTNNAIIITIAGFTTLDKIFKEWGILLWDTNDDIGWEQ